MSKFKEGDLVFEFDSSMGVVTTRVFEKFCGGNKHVKSEHSTILYSLLGKLDGSYALPNLLHATPENRRALVTLYGEDAVPELPLRGSELTKKLLETNEYVLARVSSYSDNHAREYRYMTVIVDISDDGCRFDSFDGGSAKYAVPIDPKTGEEITELDE